MNLLSFSFFFMKYDWEIVQRERNEIADTSKKWSRWIEVKEARNCWILKMIILYFKLLKKQRSLLFGSEKNTSEL